MSIWISAIGIGCIGAVCGYILFYSFKRHHQPLVKLPLPTNEVLTLLTAIGAGGAIGMAFLSLEGVNYIGPYGIGLALGVALNIYLTMRYEERTAKGTGHKIEPKKTNDGALDKPSVSVTRNNEHHKT